VLALVSAAPRARAADPDPWLGPDKALHFGASAVIAGGGYAVGTFVFPARGHALLLGAGLGLGAGAAKELLDLAGFGDPSWKDFAWDAIGTAAGLLVAWGIDVLVSGIDERHPAVLAPSASSASRGAAAAIVRF
jgi:putative lipoprotein